MTNNRMINYKIFFLMACFNFTFAMIGSVIDSAQAYACALQSNGQVLAAGSALNNTIYSTLISRYTSSGSLDSSFGSGGMVMTPIGSYSLAYDLAVQSNNKSITVGYAIVSGISVVALVRYNTDGSYDTTFGTNGITTTSIANGASANSIALQSDGNIIVAGTAINNLIPQFMVARYLTSNGTLDTTFNNAGSQPGVMITPVGVRAQATAVAIQPADGKIVVAGFSATGSGNQFTLVRYNADGSIDTSFGSSGIATQVLGTNAKIQAIKIQSNGAIVAAGSSDTLLAIARFTPAGILDTTFNSSGTIPGTLTASLGTQTALNGVTIDSSGNIVAAGFSDNNALTIRYTTTGSLDTSFNGIGYQLLAYCSQNLANDVQVLTNGDILSIGSAYTNCLLAAYTTSGSLDGAWGNSGVVIQPVGYAGVFCMQSITGTTGSSGTGTTGSTGPTGPTGTATLGAYAYYYNTSVNLTLQLLNATPFVFTGAGPVSNITLNGANNTFTLTQAGTYVATYFVDATLSVSIANTIELLLNGSVVAGSAAKLASLTTAQTAAGQAIFTVTAGATLQLVSASVLSVAGLNGTASLIIEKIA